jgi:hypothetical protein
MESSAGCKFVLVAIADVVARIIVDTFDVNDDDNDDELVTYKFDVYNVLVTAKYESIRIDKQLVQHIGATARRRYYAQRD